MHLLLNISTVVHLFILSEEETQKKKKKREKKIFHRNDSIAQFYFVGHQERERKRK
jgi:hypothetical protein